METTPANLNWHESEWFKKWLQLARHLSLLLLFVCSVNAAPHYIDNSLSTGANDGSSWPNAWRSFAAVNWGSINAGDTIYLSGGASGSSQVYNETFTFQKGGSGTGSRIMLQSSPDTGHNGVAFIDGFHYISAAGVSYVGVNGNLSGSDQHIWIQNYWDTNTASFGNVIASDNTTGNWFEGVQFSNVNNCISIQNSSGFTIRYCKGTDIRGDAAVRAANSIDHGFSSSVIELNDFELSRNDGTGPPSSNGGLMVGPDGVQGSHGLDIRNNLFHVKTVHYWTSWQHPDYTQLIGNHNLIHGNKFLNIADSGNDFDLWVNPTWNNNWIFDNLYIIDTNVDPFPEFIRVYSSSANMTSLSNFKIFNNTFVDNSQWANIRIIWRGTPAISGFEIKNNIFINAGAPYEIYSNYTGSIDIATNIYYPGSMTISWNCPNPGSPCFNYTASSFSAIEPSRIVGLPAFSSYSLRGAGNDLHLTGSDTVALDKGANLSAYTTVDKDGNPRTAPFDIGAYEYQGSGGVLPVPGSVTIVNASYSVTEGTDANAVVTLRRTGGQDGAISVHYATANGTASAGVNYTSTSGTKSWTDQDTVDKTVSIPIANTGFAGTKQFTLGIGSPSGGASLGATTNSTITITGDFTAPDYLAGMSWAATNGTISSPFIVVSNSVYQTTQITDPTASGLATFKFVNTNTTGHYTVKVHLNAPGDANNSLYIQVNSSPLESANVWDIVNFTAAYPTFEDRYAAWRGSGQFDSPQNRIITWSLSNGTTNTLTIRGREANVYFDTVSIVQPPPERATNSTPADGYGFFSLTGTLRTTAYTDQNSGTQTGAQFQILSSDLSTTVRDSGTIGAVATYTVPGGTLSSGTTYKWKARHRNNIDWGEWSAPTSFTALSTATNTLFVRSLVIGTLHVH